MNNPGDNGAGPARQEGRGKVTSPTFLKQILQEKGLHPHKRMGQHFLVDENILQKIIAAALLKPRDYVIDIGAGPGALSLSMAEQVAGVISIEWDSGLAGLLQEEAGSRGLENLHVVQGDVRRLDLEKVCRDTWGHQVLQHGAKEAIKVVANLPYYLTTPLLFQLLRGSLPVQLFIVMVQLEVARRIVAQPATRDYGVLTLLCRYYTEAELLFKVSRQVFYPPPAVDSAVVRLVRRPAPPVSVSDETTFWEIIDAAFNKRRKTLLNALEGTASLDRSGWKNVLEQAGLDPTARGETLDLEGFAKISEMFYNN